MAQNEYTKGEKTGEGKFDSFRKLFLENIINKFKRPSHNLLENKKEAGMNDK